MALYMVERDLGAVSPDQLRVDQHAVASACHQLNERGVRVRYINSAIVPTDGRGLDLFGAQSPETVKEVHAVAQVAYLRIIEILDLTPGFLQTTTSRSRQSLKKGADDTMTDSAPPELARWLADGQRFFSLCLELVEMVAAFNDLAGHVTQVVDHILQKSENGETENGEAAKGQS
jgi:hypothetical protein